MTRPDLQHRVRVSPLAVGVSPSAKKGMSPHDDPGFLHPKLPGKMTIMNFKAREIVFSQGDPSDAIFYIQKGKVSLKVLSERGRQAIIGVLGAGDFFGERCLADETFRTTTVMAIEDSSTMKIERGSMLRALRKDPQLAMTFISHLLLRNARLHEALVNHFFNNSEKRLARVLLSLARYGKEKTAEEIPKITQETLAEMVGTTRARISFFMIKFRNKRYIEYNPNRGVLRVDSSLLNVVLPKLS